MMTSFKIAFTIQLSHDYFDNNQELGLTIEPDQLTTNICKKYGFRYQSSNSQFNFFAKSNPSLEDQLNYIRKVTGKGYFEFYLLTNQSDFNIYTELPENWNGIISYNNKNTRESANGIGLKPNYDDLTVCSETGQIKIYFDALIDQIKDTQVYEISFQARKTQWNYFVVNRSNLSLNKPFIQAKNFNQFGVPNNVELVTGENALHFSSGDHLLPLKSIGTQKYDLGDFVNNSSIISKTRKKHKVIYSGLPIAGTSNTVSEKKNNKSIYTSNMYVYI